MITRFALLAMVVGAPLVMGDAALAKSPMDRFVGQPAETFTSFEALMDTFKARLARGDRDSMAKLLGLNPKELAKADDIDKNFTAIRELATQSVRTKEVTQDRQIVILGDKLWPFPFPIVMKGDKWMFGTNDGLEEVLDRRIGENELEVIATVKAYVAAQETYRRTDWDEDGVLEFAQRLISTPGNYDGLYWEEGVGVPDSPAGPFVADDELTKAADRDIGYYGYHFRVLKVQGPNVAGGAYNYVINGNMIGGFALVAWPADYGETGVQTFIVNQAGTIYQKDLGPRTAKLAEAMPSFNPDRTWKLATGENVAAVASTQVPTIKR